jgi:hypothetical protein
VIQPVWPGGTSAIPGSDFYFRPMPPRWLNNDADPNSSAVATSDAVP